MDPTKDVNNLSADVFVFCYLIGRFQMFEQKILVLFGLTEILFYSDYDFDYRQRRSEWVSSNIPVDYYKLVFSWTPSFCQRLTSTQRTRQFQCQSNDFNLVVHELWGQSRQARSFREHPRNCRNEKQLPLTTVKRYFCLMPDEVLIQSEWEKHGTCAFRTGEEYLDTIERLVGELTVPNLKGIFRDKHVDRSKVKRAFLRVNTRLHSKQIIVRMKGKDLLDIEICYNLKLKFINCYR